MKPLSIKPSFIHPRLPLTWRQGLALIAAGLLLGLSLAVRWKGPVAPVGDVPAARERAAVAVAELEREQEQLKATIARMRAELSALQRQAAQQTDQLSKISGEIEHERTRIGLTALRGPGVTVQLDDSNLAPAGPAVDPDRYLIHEYDLRDVVNLLLAGGAEAVAINDERLVNTTSIYCVGSTIMVNDTRLSPPYLVRAIGERKRMEVWLENPTNLSNLRQRIKAYGVQLKVSWSNAIDVPAYTGTFRVRYARVGEIKPWACAAASA